MIPLVLFLALGSPPPGGDPILEDFEEPTLEGWEQVSSDDHPPFNTVELVRDEPRAKSGQQFLRMRSLGGSTSVRRDPRRPWPVDASRAYHLSAYVRLSDTRRNGAAVALVWMDAEGERLGESQSATVRETGDWVEITLEVARVPTGCVSVSPRLDFLGDDVRGQCDFDRVLFEPTVAVDLHPADRSILVFAPQEPIRLAVAVAGVPARAHLLALELRSAGGTSITRSASFQSPESASLRIEFPPQAAGAYDLFARVDGVDAGSRHPVLVPNPWRSPDRGTPCGASWAGAPPAGAGEILAVARLSAGETVHRTNGPLETVLRQRFDRPQTPVVLDRLFVNARGEPLPALLALRAIEDFLAGAVPVPDPGLFPEGVHVAAFRKGDRAALALWAEDGAPEVPFEPGDGAEICPLFGAVRPLGPGETVQCGALPVLLLNVDPIFLDLGFAVDPAELPLQGGMSTLHLRLKNRSATRTLPDVRIRLEGLPKDWRAEPASLGIAAIPAGRDGSEPLRLWIPRGESEGVRTLRFEIRLSTQGRERLLQVSRRFGLRSAIRIESDVRSGPQAGSRKLVASFRNASDRAMNLLVRVRVPGWPEQLELVPHLAPGLSSRPFEYTVPDARFLDPAKLQAEIEAQETAGDRACAREIIPLR